MFLLVISCIWYRSPVSEPLLASNPSLGTSAPITRHTIDGNYSFRHRPTGWSNNGATTLSWQDFCLMLWTLLIRNLPVNLPICLSYVCICTHVHCCCWCSIQVKPFELYSFVFMSAKVGNNIEGAEKGRKEELKQLPENYWNNLNVNNQSTYQWRHSLLWSSLPLWLFWLYPLWGGPVSWSNFIGKVDSLFNSSTSEPWTQD